jgi:hypothetical protein
MRYDLAFTWNKIISNSISSLLHLTQGEEMYFHCGLYVQWNQTEKLYHIPGIHLIQSILEEASSMPFSKPFSAVG